MKKALSALVVALALAAGGAAVYFVQKSGHGAAPLLTAGYLPSDTLVLLALPDPGATADAWKTTDLYKIWAEPEMQAFLAQPLSKIPPDKQRDDVLARIGRLDPKNLFIALTALDDKTSQPHLVGGFQFKGASGEVDHLLAPAKNAFRGQFPAGKADLISYQGRSVETFETGDGNVLASAYLDDWYLIANDLALLKSTIDRLDHRTPDSAPSLEKDADFQAVGAKLPRSYETLIFGRVQPFFTKFMALAAAGGQPINPEARAEVEKGRAFGATTKIESGRLRDTFYYLAPGLRQDRASLQMSSLSMTSLDTLFYCASAFYLPDKMQLPGDAGAAGGAAGAGPLAFVNSFLNELQAKGLTLDAFRAAFGREVGLDLEWPANSAQPTVLLSLDVRDPAAAGKFVDGLTAVPVGDGTWQVESDGGLTLHTLAIPNIDAIRPTVAVTAKHAIIGLNAPSVKEGVARDAGAGANFTQSDAYKASADELGKPNVAFAYLDNRTVFERVYAVVKPAAMLGAAFLYPKLSDYVDLTKLPAAEVVAKHLSPTVYAGTLDAQGELIESTGTVTFGESAAVVGVGALAIAAPMMQSKFGSLMTHVGAPAMPAPAPAATPAGARAPAGLSSPQPAGNQ